MTRYLFIGSYTQDRKTGEHRPSGISAYTIQPDGLLINFAELGGGKNPSFLALHPDKRTLYSVNELDEGGLSAYALSMRSDRSLNLAYLNSQPTRGAAPCFISIDPAGKWLLTANYNGGSLTVHPILPDGSLSKMTDHVQHHGSGPHKNQNQAHAHSIAFAPGGRFIIACDLGIDEVQVRTLDESTGKLALHSVIKAAPGAGPRHFVFHPGLPYLYVANELDCTVTRYAWDADAGQLFDPLTWPTLPERFTEWNSVADIHFHPTGKYLYVSNRGHNSIAIFEVDAADGRLSPLGYVLSGGETPRNFTLTPEGEFVYVAHQDSDNIVVFWVDEGGARLAPTGEEYALPAPVYVQVVDL